MRWYQFMLILACMPPQWVLGDDANLFPLQKLEIGVSVEPLKAAYPGFKEGFVKKNASGETVEGIILLQIEGNAYWDSAVVTIKDSKVESWSYVRTKDFDRVKNDVPRVFGALKKSLGENYERKIVQQLLKQGKVRAPLFVWTLDERQIAFSHTPFKEHKSGDPFICQLTIASKGHPLEKLFESPTLADGKDSQLFEDVMSGSRKANKPWVIVLLAAIGIGICVFLVLQRKADNRVTVINHAASTIENLSVKVCNRDYVFKDIRQGGSTSASFDITGDSGFWVEGRFANGQTIQGSFGYVTKGYSKQKATIIVNDDGTIKGTQ
jgi:hypothetical protein